MSLIQEPPVICYVAAKSGGHIMPALTLAQHEKSRDASTRILFISSSCDLDKKILNNSSVIDCNVSLPLYSFSTKPGFLKYLYLYVELIVSFFKSLFYLWQEKPTHLVSMGGLISVPVCFAAMILQIPFDMWELNVVPGKAVSALKYFARTIYICFSDCRQALLGPDLKLASYPVRFQGAIDCKDIREKLEIDCNKKILLVLGGSQGSSFMNNALSKMLIEALNKDEWYIIHQAGQNEYELVTQTYKQSVFPSYVFSFTSDIAAYYACADFIIARAGAGSIFEIFAFKKNALLIPLHASTTDHQSDNARAIVREHPELFDYIEQNLLTFSDLKQVIEKKCTTLE